MEQIPQDTFKQILQNRQMFQSAIASASQPTLFPQSRITTTQGFGAGLGTAIAGQQQRALQEGQRTQYLAQTQAQSAAFEKGVAV